LASVPHTLFGRYIHVAGSANRARPTDLIRYAHDLMRDVTTEILRNGGGLVIFAGREPFQDATVAGSPALIFDWTVVEAVDTAESKWAQTPRSMDSST
jgi:hypothetical protein